MVNKRAGKCPFELQRFNAKDQKGILHRSQLKFQSNRLTVTTAVKKKLSSCIKISHYITSPHLSKALISFNRGALRQLLKLKNPMLKRFG